MSSSVTASPAYRALPGTLHTILLAGAFPLFLGALLSDIAYYQSYQIQWTNFASWLIAGGLVFSGFALLFALANLIRLGSRPRGPLWYFLLLLLTWIIGLINAFEHAKDAWASMPGSLVLSVLVTLLSCAAAWMGLRPRAGEAV